MDINRFIDLAYDYDLLAGEYDALKYDLYVSGGDEMHNLSPKGKRTCNRLRTRQWKIRTEMDAMESTIVDFVQDTKFDRDFQLQRKLGSTEKIQRVVLYFLVEHRASEHIRLDDGREISEFIRINS